ncbi:hypothetical protein BT93_L1880 [Corymbia citriodora subsp. variegata]|uniref:Uncharacterized protein n=1 Tax=Corymbia citriodora subsp. variegata TaxID=360336 RepID=A0A8T0CNZ9_CORYI|nr:hypothetical protein BT93_L1880 [Corymbia citriodora subsp. variegata]
MLVPSNPEIAQLFSHPGFTAFSFLLPQKSNSIGSRERSNLAASHPFLGESPKREVLNLVLFQFGTRLARNLSSNCLLCFILLNCMQAWNLASRILPSWTLG